MLSESQRVFFGIRYVVKNRFLVLQDLSSSAW
jgi:hypothetical protein